ncbi:MAG: hypothetical protein AB1324_01320 [Candidatus Micrarchaeota archaeon]
MKVKCDKCDTSANADVDRLVMLGWSRLTISNPSRKTFTRCPRHRAGLTEEVGKARGARIGG